MQPVLRILLVACILLGGAVPGFALTEADAVQHGMTQPHVRALLEARRQIAAGDALAVGRRANPQIELARERLGLPGGAGTERSLWVTQRFDVAGVRGLERRAAREGEVAQGARTQLTARELRAEIRLLFHEVLLAHARSETVTAWSGRLSELVDAVAVRVEAGDAAHYDLLRLQRELSLVRGEVREAEQKAVSARDRLFTFIGGEARPLEGQLLPPALQSAPESVLQGHPSLVALDAQADGAALSARAAARRTWPELTLGVGRRELREPGASASGNQLLLGVEIPIFDRGRGERVAFEGRERALRAERRLLEIRLQADARRSQRQLEAHRQVALELQASLEDESVSLVLVAEAAYAGGEIGVMELIDAHRSDLAIRQEIAAHAWAAREAYILWQMFAGD